MVDAFTRYCSLVNLYSKTDEVAVCMVSVLASLGKPSTIHTDNVSEFRTKWIQHLKMTTTIYPVIRDKTHLYSKTMKANFDRIKR